MMKKIVLLLVVINLIIGIIIAGFFYISETYPFAPGDQFFGLQRVSEKIRLQLTPRGEKQALMAIDLADRRLADLAQAEGHQRVDAAVLAFEDALDQAILYISKMEQSSELQLKTFPQLNLLLEQARIVLYSIEKLDECQLTAELREKIENLIAQRVPVNTDVVINTDHSGPIVINAELISFLGQEIDHSVYPLNGRHLTTDCQSCHLTGEYANTQTQCEDCHQYQPKQISGSNIYLINLTFDDLISPSTLYPNHFEGTCDECHNEESWAPVEFDHREIFECKSCHIEDVPDITSDFYKVHSAYPNKCGLCHQDTESWNEIEYAHENIRECLSCHEEDEPNRHYTESSCDQCHIDTTDWNIFDFDHTGYSDCQTCHRTPVDHYLGTCATCHRNTDNWNKYNFYHMGLNDCQSCHTAPKDHWEGQCSSCHNTTAWTPARFKHLNYTVYQCATCHQNDAPPGHYCEDCCRCHNTADWGDYTFDHTNYTDCVACHAGEAPSGHYGDLCANCHNTRTWSDYYFNHTGFVDCVSCHTAPSNHYSGQCSKCHTTSNWSNIIFVHTSADINCTGCHQAPAGHWPGQCGNCHISTSNWLVISFDHTTYKDCKSCHDRPEGDHPSRGQCSQCHNTTTWLIPTATPTNTPKPTSTNTPEPTATNTPDPLATDTPEPPATNTPDPLATDTPEPTATDTPEPTATNTPVVPTETDTPEPPTPTPPHHDGEDCSACHP